MKKLINTLLLAVMMLSAVVVTANATPVINYSGGSATSSVVLNLEPYEGSGSTRRFSVTVPVSCPIWVLKDNTVVTPNNAEIVNNSSEAVRVVSVKLKPLGDFRLVDFSEEFGLSDKNSYKFGMCMNNDTFNPNTKLLSMSDRSWNYIETDSTLPLSYTARFAPITKEIKNFDMAEIVFTVAFVN